LPVIIILKFLMIMQAFYLFMKKMTNILIIYIAILRRLSYNTIK